MKAQLGLARHRRTLLKFWVNARLPLIIGGIVIGLLVVGGIGYGKYKARAEADERRAVEATTKYLVGDISKAFDEQIAAITRLGEGARFAQAFRQGGDAATEFPLQELGGTSEGLKAVHLVPAGLDSIDRKMIPPIGYAVLDLLRKSEQTGKAPPPEVHLLGDEGEHVVVLTRVQDGDEVLGHVRWVIDLAILRTVLDAARLGGPGYAELLQPLSKGKPLVLGSIGSAAFKQGPPLHQDKVPGTAWQVAFWPEGAQEPASSSTGVAMLPIGGGAILVLLLLGGGFMLMRRRRARDEPVEPAEPAPSRGSVSVAAKREAEPALEFSDGLPPLPEVEESDEKQALGAMPAASSASAKGGGRLSPTIFRAYDIRGIVDQTLSKEVVYDIGRAIGSEAYDRGQQTIVVGCDGRLSGPDLLEALTEGLRSTGRDVIDIGRVPTPVLYFATHYLNTGSGVIVTGSHNPPQYNGLKIMLGGETLFGEAIANLRHRIESGSLLTGQGSHQSMDVLPEYIRRVTEDIPVALGNAFKVVVDCGNGVAGDVAPKLIRALGHDVIELFCEVDGNFPNHHPDPSKPENLKDLVAAVKENEADIGFAFDGDGDRLGVVDARGRVIWPDLQMMLYARDVLSRNPGATIVYDVKCSSRLGKVIKKLGGDPLMWKTGHSFIKSKMRETGALLAGEMSGHIFFKERWYGFDDALYTAARMLELLLGFKQAPTDVFAKLPTGVTTPELNVNMSEGEHIAFMERFLASVSFPDATVSTIDGLRADFNDGWGLVRASNTTPCLVLRFEADNKDALARIQNRFKSTLLEQEPSLNLPF